jgi:6-phosphogluconate dehydrogenase
MKLAMLGLGRMGGNMARRLLRGGHQVVAWNRTPEPARALASEGAEPASTLAEVVSKLPAPRVCWLMVPAGEPTEQLVRELAQLLKPGDIVIDGGNSFYKDDVRRARELAKKGIRYVDAGTSGGVWGLERGYCLMIGGETDAVRRLDPIFRTLAPGRGSIPETPGRLARQSTAEEGYLHCGPPGAGHFVKMIHNGIEYGLMQAYAEGFDLLRGARTDDRPEGERYALDLADVAEVWRRGSVVGSWLLDLTAAALTESPELEEFRGFVQDSGEGRWTIEAALEEAVPVTVLAASLFARFRSRQERSFADRLLSAMRKQFGGHVERPAGG